jgi:glycosyltransferase involved in cell wall biosynthesis
LPRLYKTADWGDAYGAIVKIACVSNYDALDPRAFGGRVYYHVQAMQRVNPTMHFVGPLSYRKYLPMLYLKRRYYAKIKNQRYSPWRDRHLVMDLSHQIARKIRQLDPDIIFSLESPGSQPVAYLEAKQPIVLWTDTSFAGFLDELEHEHFCKETVEDGIENERAALARTTRAIYYSEWAARGASQYYDLTPGKVRVIPSGPAFDDSRAITLTEAEEIVSARPKDRCRLLFVGTDWIRKGGATAFEVALKLNTAGLATELIVVGCEPPLSPLPEFVRVYGYISRETDEAKLHHLFKTSHFMLLPSRSDCSPLVLVEANAWALPSIATNVGGIPEIVKAGVNGVTFALSTDPDEYCSFIDNLFTNYEQYEQLALSAFGEFQTRLNNRTAALSVLNAMRELL